MVTLNIEQFRLITIVLVFKLLVVVFEGELNVGVVGFENALLENRGQVCKILAVELHVK